jgi:predicted outer membrane repeat protein
MRWTANLKTMLVMVIFLKAMVCTVTARTIYVDDDVPADFNNIQAAIDTASTGDTVLVADGTYTGVGNHDIDFHGKAITVRSENGPVNCIIDCQATITNLHRGFYFHSSEGPNSVIMGFTITSGYADYGGGVYCDSSNPKIANCRFIRNLAKIDGGGVHNSHSHPIITNCTFLNNGTYPGLTGHSFGGGINNYYSSPTVIRCRFEGNYTAVWGGGMANAVYSSPLVINCAFIRNFGPGAGMFNTNYCNPTVVNCAFIGNGTGAGAGMYNNVESTPTVINCTFTGNRSDWYGGGMSNGDSGTTVINCIFWGNWDKSGPNQSSQIRGGTPIIYYCCVQGWTGALGGIGNIGEDPLLVDIDGADDILGTADDNPRLVPESPCVNAGDNTAILADTMDIDGDGNTTEPIPFDVDDNPRFINDTVDMGAYEYQLPRTLYVDQDASGQVDGSSWTNAYTNLQDALAIARYGDNIWVSEGIYRPDQGTWITVGNREATFQLKSGVAMYGGFLGVCQPPPPPPPLPPPQSEGYISNDDTTITTADKIGWVKNNGVVNGDNISLDQANPNTRNINVYKTILSGDLKADDVGGTYHPSRNENSYHVINGGAADSVTVLDGFTITGGNANGGEEHNNGGGMYNEHGSPTLVRCVFSGNFADGNGGGIFNGERSRPTLINIQFVGNSAASHGGAIYGTGTGPAFISNCTFIGNLAPSGSSLACDSLLQGYPSDIEVTNCIFWQEALPPPGQASDPSPADGATEVSITSDLNWIGDMYSTSQDVYFGINPTPDINEFKGNQTSTLFDPGGMTYSTTYYWRIDALNAWGKNVGPVWSFTTRSGGPPPPPPPPPPGEAEESLFASVSKEIFNADNSIITVIYSDIRGGWPGEGNIDTDPCFLMPGYWDANGTPEDANDDFWVDGDYHLKSQAGRWDANSESWVQDDVSSPCIDSGDLMSPIGLEPFPNGGILNMGAYGWTAEASKSYFGEPICETVIAGDINGDCRVNFLDFRFIMLSWLEDNTPPPPLPGQAISPNPADGVADVNAFTDLSWMAGSYAMSHDVYFGTSIPLLFIGNQTATVFDAGLMIPLTKYFWRIDEVNSSGKTTGMLWSFTTSSQLPPLPGQVSNPNPADGATAIDSDADLSWTAGSYTNSHDVYFGVSFPLTFMGNQSANTFDPGLMNPLTKFYWRIDEVNSAGKNTGPVWSFTTKESIPPPPPPL